EYQTVLYSLLPFEPRPFPRTEYEIQDAGHDNRQREADVCAIEITAEEARERPLIVDHRCLIYPERRNAKAQEHRDDGGNPRWKFARCLIVLHWILASAQQMLDDH